jgi:hypothetical protein
MWGFPGVAGHPVLSAGTVLIVGGGLALYQMTSLVLGPGGSRQLHVSLTIADPEERSDSWTAGRRVALGTLAGPSHGASARAGSRSQGAPATAAGHPAAAPVAGAPVTTPPPAARPSVPPVPTLPPVTPIVIRPTPQPVSHSGDDAD